MNQDTDFVHIGSRTVNRDQIAEIDHNFRQSMSQGGEACSLIVLRTGEGPLPENYRPYLYVTDPEGRNKLVQFCGTMADSRNLEVITQGLKGQKWGGGPNPGRALPADPNPGQPQPAAGKRGVTAATRRRMSQAQAKRHQAEKAKAATTA